MEKQLLNFKTLLLVCLMALLGGVRVSAQEKTVTFVAGTDKGTNSVSGKKDILTKDGVTISCTSAAFATDEYRFYASSAATIAVESGNITKVEFTCTASETAKNGPSGFSKSSVGKYSYSGNTGAWEGSSQEIKFSKLTQQVRASKIVVTYTSDDKPQKKTTTLTFADPSNRTFEFNATEGTTFANVATLSPVVEGATISYESNNVELASVTNDGEVTVTTDKAGTATITASFAGNDNYEASTASYTITVKPKEVVGENRWVKTTLSDLLPTDQVVIVDVTSQRAMSNDKGTSAAPTAVSVTLDGETLTGTVADNCVWNVTKNSDNTYTFFPNGTTEKWLYTTNTNNGVRVGTSENNCFEDFSEGSYNGLKNTATSRFVGVYDSKDWRCYTSVNQNIENTSIAYYKYASNKTATKIVFEKGDATFDQGTETPLYENAAKVTTANGTVVEGATVTYTSSDAEHAVVDEKGAVLVDATVPGTYTITASFAGDDTYASAKASYTITVNKVLQLTGEGTLDKPYTVADVIAIVNDGAQTKNPVYVKGVVSKVVSTANNIEQYKNCDYFIVDEEGSSASVEAFRGKYLGNTDFTSLDQIAAGDKVILCGVMTKYKDIVELDRDNYIAKFWDIAELVLDEKADNNTIEAKRHATVYMDRTFNANAWNTLVLPFDMTSEQVTATFGADTKLANYMGTTMNEDGTYTLNFKTTDVIKANTPVFVYGAKNVDTQTIEDVNVVVGDPVATPASAAFAFQGSYGKMQVNAGDWFISSDNNFYRAKGTESMKATRALFRATTAEAAAKGLTISIDGEATAIQGIVTDKADSDAPAYNLAGQRVSDNYRGIIIKGGKKYLNK